MSKLQSCNINKIVQDPSLGEGNAESRNEPGMDGSEPFPGPSDTVPLSLGESRPRAHGTQFPFASLSPLQQHIQLGFPLFSRTGIEAALEVPQKGQTHLSMQRKAGDAGGIWGRAAESPGVRRRN